MVSDKKDERLSPAFALAAAGWLASRQMPAIHLPLVLAGADTQHSTSHMEGIAPALLLLRVRKMPATDVPWEFVARPSRISRNPPRPTPSTICLEQCANGDLHQLHLAKERKRRNSARYTAAILGVAGD
jgi:hypothetical protein